MREIIHIYKEGVKQIVAYQNYAEPEPGENYNQFPKLKEWAGVYLIYSEATEEIIKDIISKGVNDIGEYFPGYTGSAYIVGTKGSNPIEVFFIGSGPLKNNEIDI